MMSRRYSLNGDSVCRAIPLVLTAALLFWVMRYCGYGFDLTDEGYYLLLIQNPLKYFGTTTTQFGFIYQALGELLAGNIAAMRRLNAAITFALAWTLADLTLRMLFIDGALAKLQRLAASASLATTSLVILMHAALWNPTPSYNALAFQAILGVSIGILLLHRSADPDNVLGWIVIGISGWLAFMAKPTTAAILAVTVAAFLTAERKWTIKGAGVSLGLAVGLLAATALAIDGSVGSFVQALKDGITLDEILDGGHSIGDIFRLEWLPIGGDKMKIAFVGVLIIIVSMLKFADVDRPDFQALKLSSSVILAAVGLAIVLGAITRIIPFGGLYSGLAYRANLGLLFLALPIAAVAHGLLSQRFGYFSGIGRRRKVLAAVFLTMPYAFAFGTNGNYWISACSAAFFWVLLALVLLDPSAKSRRPDRILGALTLTSQLVTIILVQAALETPYRQMPYLREASRVEEIGETRAKLVVSAELASYISEVRQVASRAGFKHGDPVIDMTGVSPGLLYALGADAVGMPWIIGGYPGSDRHAVAGLKRVPCDRIVAAWLLIEPEGSGEISPSALESFGADLKRDYNSTGSFLSPKRAGDHIVVRPQQLLRPVRTVKNATESCVARRTK